MEKIELQNLINATGGRLIGNAAGHVRFQDLQIDSRRVRPGDLFWALHGENLDGHAFVTDARRNGATMCVIHDEQEACGSGPAIKVTDTLKALWDYAAWHRRQQHAVFVAVTGSFGKTTTREMIHSALGQHCSGTRSPKNFNNQIGLPLSLLSVEADHQYAVLELGASRPGEIRDLTAIADPDIGVITGIGPAHLDGFGSEQRIVQAKAELLESLTCGGFAVLAGDDPQVRGMAKWIECPTIYVGQEDHNHVRAEHLELANDRLIFLVAGKRFEVPACGRHHLTAALVAIAVAREFGMSQTEIARGLAGFEPIPGRCRFERFGTWSVIDDSYNANPKSVEAACRLLGDWRGAAEKVLVIGDMLELGDREDECHYQAGRLAAQAGIHRIVAFGRAADMVIQGARGAGMPPNCLIACQDLQQIFCTLTDWLQPEDTILVKGSRGMRMERVVEWLHRQAAPDSQYTFSGRARARHTV